LLNLLQAADVLGVTASVGSMFRLMKAAAAQTGRVFDRR
jgi:hypothetical protein